MQIGATPICQRIFIPIRNYIKDFAENYELNVLGGELTWRVDRTENDSDGAARTTCSLLVKEKANDPKHIATLTIGSHGEGDPTTLDLVVNDSGLNGAVMKAELKITKTGEISWTTEQTFTVTAKSDVTVESTTGLVTIKSMQDTVIQSLANIKMTAAVNAEINAVQVDVNSPLTNINGLTNVGGVGALPAAKGPPLVAALTAILIYLDKLVPLVGDPPGDPTAKVGPVVQTIQCVKAMVV